MPTRLLYLGYESDERAKLGIEEELAAISAARLRASNGNALTLKVERNLDLAAWPALLAELRPSILHLSAHGAAGGRLRLYEAGGFVDVDPFRIVEILQAAGDGLRLVVLTACFGERVAQAIRDSGRIAIGSTQRLPADQAASFAGQLYGQIAEGGDLLQAFTVAHAAMASHGQDQRLYKICEPDSVSARTVVLASRMAENIGTRTVEITQQAQGHQIVLILDAYDSGFTRDEVLAQVDLCSPYRDRRVTLRLSEQMARVGAPRITQGQEHQIDWPGLAEATQALLDQASAALPDDGKPRDYFIAGNAPHAIFAHVGFVLSRWEGRSQVLLHRSDDNQRWMDPVVLDGSTPEGGPLFFDKTLGLERANTTNAELGLFLSSQGDEAPPATVEGFFRANNRPCGAVVSLLHQRRDAAGRPTRMDSRTAVSAATELVLTATDLSTKFQHHSGLALFFKGPALLGFLAGRALNPRQHTPSPLALTYYNRGQDAYALVYTLPFQPTRASALPQDEGSQLRRRQTYDVVMEGFEQLRANIAHEDIIPPAAFTAGGARFAQRLLRDLKGLVPGRKPEGEVFELSVPQRTLKIGEGLLEPLHDLLPEDQRRFGRLLVLHELAHQPQRLLGTNYQGVGRASVVLEDLDFQADTAALLAATRWEIRDQGSRGQRGAGAILRDYLGTHLRVLAAFDRMEQGCPLGRLPERRLRRYLIWAIQAARAEAAHSPEDVAALLDQRLYAELAPLSGRLDGRGDKLVLGARPETQLYVGLGGRLIRHPRLPENFEPGALVDLVRELRLEELVAAMRFVVAESAAVLTPWTDP